MEESSAFFVNGVLGPDSPHAQQPAELCAEGKWSVLYKVDKDGRFRILKALKPEFRGDPLYEGALRKEFEITYSLSHPNIREVYAFSFSESLGNYIEMEWVDGTSLADLMENSVRLPKVKARKIVAGICDALSYIHNRQIVHRDIKPSNILVTHNGLNPKIIDFGLADADSYSILKSPAGTASYAAPELLSGEKVNQRADIYSLGRIIRILLPSCRHISNKCTRRSPSARYDDSDEVKAALRRRSNLSWLLPSAVAVVVAVSVGAFYLFNRPLPEAADSQTLLDDASAIDALFHEATDLIEGQ